MPQKSTRNSAPITSGTVLPSASINCCLVGFQGVVMTDRWCRKSLNLIFETVRRIQNRKPQRTGRIAYALRKRLHRTADPVATAPGSDFVYPRAIRSRSESAAKRFALLRGPLPSLAKGTARRVSRSMVVRRHRELSPAPEYLLPGSCSVA